jgi:hypothetical protein
MGCYQNRATESRPPITWFFFAKSKHFERSIKELSTRRTDGLVNPVSQPRPTLQSQYPDNRYHNLALYICQRFGLNDPYLIANNIEIADDLRLTRLILSKEYGFNPDAMLDWTYAKLLDLRHDHLRLQKMQSDAYEAAKKQV